MHFGSHPALESRWSNVHVEFFANEYIGSPSVIRVEDKTSLVGCDIITGVLQIVVNKRSSCTVTTTTTTSYASTSVPRSLLISDYMLKSAHPDTIGSEAYSSYCIFVKQKMYVIPYKPMV